MPRSDLFISHASEDKDDFAHPLAEMLRARGVSVWYDEFSLSLGDSLSESIDEGLATCRFGAVILSQHFFNKPWPRRELRGLVARSITEGPGRILPIWHKVGRDDVIKFSPPLADIVSISSSRGIQQICEKVVDVTRPDLTFYRSDVLRAKGGCERAAFAKTGKVERSSSKTVGFHPEQPTLVGDYSVLGINEAGEAYGCNRSPAHC